MKQLIELPSVFSQKEEVAKALDFYKKLFEKNPPNYTVSYDSENNLIAVPTMIDKSRDIVYLSAHRHKLFTMLMRLTSDALLIT